MLRALIPLIALLIPLVTALSPARSLAWGHVSHLSGEAAPAFLIFPALRGEPIAYCLDFGEARFDPDSIALQVEAALEIWLAPIRQATQVSARPVRVNCSENRHQLRIDLSPEQTYPDYGAFYRTVKLPDGRFIGTIRIDSKFVFNNLFTKDKILDFRELIAPGESLAATLDRISIREPHTLRQYARERGLRPLSLYWSTYRILIHELGHAFGLCDTYREGVKECDPLHQTRKHPDSVMNSSHYFYLTADDLAGVNALIGRFHP